MLKYLLTLVSLLLLIAAVDTEYQNTSSDTLAADIEINEWRVPWDDSRPRDPYVARDGNIWFVGQRTHYVARFNPDTEEFTKYDLEDGAGPHTVIVDDEGYPWYAGNRANHIGKIDPETGKITKFMMPEDGSARDPHTMAFDKNGDIWFTSQGANSIGKLDVETGEPTIIPVETPRARPYGIVMDQERQQPWIVLFGTNKLATVNPESMELTEIELPNEGTRPRRLDISGDGNIWFGDYSRGYVGKYNPENGSYNEWEMPSGESARPYGVVMDNEDRFWLVETGVNPNKFVGFDTQNESFITSEPIESGGGTVRHMVFNEKTNSIWFGTDTNYLGRAKPGS